VHCGNDLEFKQARVVDLPLQKFFLMTGMREQEVMHCSWADINLSRGTLTVRYKPEYGVQPEELPGA